MEASFPLRPGTLPVHRPQFKAHPRAQEVFGKCVDQLEADAIIERRSSPCCSPITIVSKDEIPRSCIDHHRQTLNKFLVGES